MTQKKLLIANRSEIACRIYQTAKELGWFCVGIAENNDITSCHIPIMDELHIISSYLQSDEIIALAKKTQCMAVHPGYGFLSEQPSFAQKVKEAGIIFIGPPADSMQALGDKISSKKKAQQLKIPTTPWLHIGFEHLHTQATQTALNSLGYPLMLKSSSGGGGKGMRRITSYEHFCSEATSCYDEVKQFFGQTSFYVEKTILNAKHIEVQIFCYQEEQHVHFFERDCTLQRHHQKIWEEAPAQFIQKDTKDKLYTYALQFFRNTTYQGPATVEFLVERIGHQENIYFLEINTRLQVEHTITEMITGEDIVALQLYTAMKEHRIPKINEPLGHSIQVRICAEDPSLNFIPTGGLIEKIYWPMGAGIRIESGIAEGQKITTHYDSLLAKIIVHAPTREHALQRLRYALMHTIILGITTNIQALIAMCEHADIQQGAVHTYWIQENSFCEQPWIEDTHSWVSLYQQISLQQPPTFMALTQTSPWQKNM